MIDKYASTASSGSENADESVNLAGAVAPPEFILHGGYTHERPPDGFHLPYKFEDGSVVVNCTGCGATTACSLAGCNDTRHFHEDCGRFEKALDRFTLWWWRIERIRAWMWQLPKVIRLRALIFWHSQVLLQRAGFKHAFMSPSCISKNARCITFKYETNPVTLAFRPLGYVCTECGFIIEGTWRDMQR